MVLFLTRIPVPYRVDYSEEALESGIKYLPLVGLIIGLILYGFSEFLTMIGLDRGIVVALSWTLYIIVTGGLHIDGLADTFDGHFSNRDRDRVLEIMKDSQIGSFGVLGIVSVLGLSIVCSYYLDNSYFLFYPILGRGTALLICRVNKYARDSGMGKVFVEKCTALDAFTGNIFLMLLVVYAYGWTGLLPPLITIAVITASVSRIAKAIGGITGDTIGFTIEVSQMVYLIVAYILSALNVGF